MFEYIKNKISLLQRAVLSVKATDNFHERPDLVLVSLKSECGTPRGWLTVPRFSGGTPTVANAFDHRRPQSVLFFEDKLTQVNLHVLIKIGLCLIGVWHCTSGITEIHFLTGIRIRVLRLIDKHLIHYTTKRGSFWVNWVEVRFKVKKNPLISLLH